MQKKKTKFLKKVLAFFTDMLYDIQVPRMQYSIWLIGQAVKTPPSHGGNRGSIPLSAVYVCLDSSLCKRGTSRFSFCLKLLLCILRFWTEAFAEDLLPGRNIIRVIFLILWNCSQFIKYIWIKYSIFEIYGKHLRPGLFWCILFHDWHFIDWYQLKEWNIVSKGCVLWQNTW